jgi:hypothetical protein
MHVRICAHSTIETEYIPQATIKQHTLLNICAQYLLICTLVFRGANPLFWQKRYNDECIKDRKSLQRIVCICAPPPFFNFLFTLFLFNKMSLSFHLFFLNLACSCPHSCTQMLTVTYVCRSYYPSLIIIYFQTHEPGPGFLMSYVVVFFFMRDD